MTLLDTPLILTGCAILPWFGTRRDRGRHRVAAMPALGRLA
jgi:hypothetical protein